MKTLFFEVLNTLVRLTHFETESARLIRDELNIRISLDELASQFRKEWEDRYNMLISKGVYRSLRQLARETMISLLRKYSLSLSPAELDYFGNAISSLIVETSELYPDVIEAINALSQMSISMYILTNLDNDVAKKILLRNNLLRHFKGVVSSDLTKVGKPAIKIFQAALNRAGVPPSDALIVSGLVEDVIGAKFLDLKVVFVRRVDVQLPVKPFYEINTLTQLPEIISKLT
ncbi:Haloacid dehalogenase domain protein hydrolase [Vulcanisaeta moutnovskia 768-28]|uniref:Haloacid dehalogenase domain protein hydrolase n=1 Tax=Vulcanisaeta moutnovskia (strain 768-28) TaxID=985053 RepID=F0QUW8_VULM7|nr:HAD-IA family hydrolase [Vulcanisaeta moutnovskia]ADY01950.1 Haloacid dehalogenase domain protein hydrolase [Vulcanisaeta moutnovskia 768-28]